VSGDEAGEGTDLRENTHLIHLFDDGIENLILEWSEDDSFVLDGIDNESSIAK